MITGNKVIIIDIPIFPTNFMSVNIFKDLINIFVFGQ